MDSQITSIPSRELETLYFHLEKSLDGTEGDNGVATFWDKISNESNIPTDFVENFW